MRTIPISGPLNGLLDGIQGKFPLQAGDRFVVTGIQLSQSRPADLQRMGPASLLKMKEQPEIESGAADGQIAPFILLRPLPERLQLVVRPLILKETLFSLGESP